MKPVALVERAIRNSSTRRDVVLDPVRRFRHHDDRRGASGRRARLSSLILTTSMSSVQRWQALTGDIATLSDTGQTFAEVGASRLSPTAPAADVTEEGAPA